MFRAVKAARCWSHLREFAAGGPTKGSWQQKNGMEGDIIDIMHSNAHLYVHVLFYEVIGCFTCSFGIKCKVMWSERWSVPDEHGCSMLQQYWDGVFYDSLLSSIVRDAILEGALMTDMTSPISCNFCALMRRRIGNGRKWPEMRLMLMPIIRKQKQL